MQLSSGFMGSLSESEDDVNEPENVFPVKDPYLSEDDNDSGHEKLLLDKLVDSSEVTLCQFACNFDLSYGTYVTHKEMAGISPEALLVESLKFCFGEDLPAWYAAESCNLDENGLGEIGQQLYQLFEDNNLGHKWLKEEFCVDYTEAKDDDIYKQTVRIFQYQMMSERSGKREIAPAFDLAFRFHELLSYLREDLKRRKWREDKYFNEKEKHDQITGVIIQILSYLRIPACYNGECNLDFKYKVKGSETETIFEVKPDVVTSMLNRFPGKTYTAEQDPLQPLLIFHVFGPSSNSTSVKNKVFSKEKNLNDDNIAPNTPSTDNQVLSHKMNLLNFDTEKPQSSYMKEKIEKNKENCFSSLKMCSHRESEKLQSSNMKEESDKKKENSSSDTKNSATDTEMEKLLSINMIEKREKNEEISPTDTKNSANDTDKKNNVPTCNENKREELCSKSSLLDLGRRTDDPISSTCDNKIKNVCCTKKILCSSNENSWEKLRSKITSCGPKLCRTGESVEKLFGQLPLQLFGALQRKTLSNLSQNLTCTQNETVFGLFVMNEYVFLVKMTSKDNANLVERNIENIENDKMIVYAQNIWFNLNKPNDRMAFLSFLFHFNNIERGRMYREWVESVQKEYTMTTDDDSRCSTPKLIQNHFEKVKLNTKFII